MRTALAALLFGALAAACSGGGTHEHERALDVVQKGSGGPANLACNHTDYRPASLGSALSFAVHSMDMDGASVAGARVAVWDSATATTTGSFAVTDGDALGVLTAEDSAPLALKTTGPVADPPWVDTYTFGLFTPPPGGEFFAHSMVISGAVRDLFLQLSGHTPEELAGTVSLASNATDCDGDALQHAVVAGLPRCADTDEVPCAVYIRGGVPSLAAADTGDEGYFGIGGIPADALFPFEVEGVLSEGDAPEVIGVASIRAPADTVGMGTTSPPED